MLRNQCPLIYIPGIGLPSITSFGEDGSLTLILLMWRIGQAPNSIPIYEYIHQDATLHSLFMSGNCSTCFGWYFYTSSGPVGAKRNKPLLKG
jgi:hypothetical protein